ncbi:MAG: HAMP domain-containing histidine kinase [Oscillatoriales cyanobacterium RM2_1_1]|nr:HAMP domain-containing histidine kinase [Oscillatoriales cyanobacterium SM2_3_0]NJO46204.1 HAMP domain-containing histidine kinase [Oscillatoriales cyanobacterium RM2_1_1]
MLLNSAQMPQSQSLNYSAQSINKSGHEALSSSLDESPDQSLELEQLRQENAYLKALLGQQNPSLMALVFSSSLENYDLLEPCLRSAHSCSQCCHCQDWTSDELLIESIWNKAIDGVAAISRAKQFFLANISHELRTPLNAILGHADLLREDAIAQSQVSYLEDIQVIQQEGQRLLRTINHLLNLTRLEAGQTPLKLLTFDPVNIAEILITQFSQKAHINQNQLEVSYGETLGLVYTDPRKLQQILYHLLDNALKFTQGGKVTLYLTQKESQGKVWLCCQVADTGIGIAPEQQPLLFAAFTQEDDSTSREYQGMGLGLTTSDRLCQILGGHLSVSSQVGKGSTFTVRLPAHFTAEPSV